MTSKRYYWLKLKEDFFEDDTISWLEEQDGGKDFIIFYLKLSLKSLTDEGFLIRYVGENLIPYDVRALAKLTNTPINTVTVAMKIFLEIGLISQMESGEIYMNQINEMIGSETESAKRVRKHRARKKLEGSGEKEDALQSNTYVIESNTDIDIEKEKEKDIEKEKEKELRNHNVRDIADFWDSNGFGINNITGKTRLLAWLDDSKFPDPGEMILYAMEISCSNNARTLKYIEAILKNWENENLLTLEEIKANEERRNKNGAAGKRGGSNKKNGGSRKYERNIRYDFSGGKSL